MLGIGFTFDDAAAVKGEAESLETMRALIAKDARNAERIFPISAVRRSPRRRPTRIIAT